MAQTFSIFLVILTVVSGLIWLIDSLFFAPKRRENSLVNGGKSGDAELPYLVDTAQQIFPVVAFIMVLRSFLYEPFQIPSGSMMPTLLVGDFILVEKYTYGLKDPVTRTKFWDMGSPERGDIVVFKYPPEPQLDYIKRVVGLPGDRIFYRQKQITVVPACPSGQDCAKPYIVPMQQVDNDEFVQNMVPLNRFVEQLGEAQHEILQHPILAASPSQFYRQPGTAMDEWVVPQNSYFVLGDNRDNSRDSRFWGFVSDEHLVGKATAIWISFEFERGSDSFLPSWFPTGIRFNRIGGLQ
jgi:signal peptidase I